MKKRCMQKPWLLHKMEGPAMCMVGTTPTYPKQSTIEQVKKWLSVKKNSIFRLCGCAALILIILFTVTSPILALFLCFLVGLDIGITIVDIFY